MINSIYAYRDGTYVITGDSKGTLSTWDLRIGKAISSTLNSEGRHSISCIHVPSQGSSSDPSREEESKYLAVNSYDNVIHVYNRGAMPPSTTLRTTALLIGHVNKNWPIRSSFFLGKNYEGWPVPANDEQSSQNFENMIKNPSQKSVHNTLILATGSADGFAYIFDVGDGHSSCIQRLHGHSDRVYAVDFHPCEPWLATASADCLVKLWSAKSQLFLRDFDN
ncbi:uncharacterized protein LOC135121887 [Zophobas morio]|uniref:uncharacterized protein LOC135121887 n=1 Tax=Zophobas morio TaxID=2755281 RepID=UPI003083323B